MDVVGEKAQEQPGVEPGLRRILAGAESEKFRDKIG
jgi:hypothetical protein